MKRPILAVGALALAASALGATPAAAHDAVGINGTVTCAGAYSVSVRADVWDDIRLIVTLRGTVIRDVAIPGDDTSVREFGPFTGTGGHPGDAISAHTSDNAHVVTGSLRLIGSPCRQPRMYHPRAEVLQPCGDPQARVRLDNRASTGSVPFVIRWTDGGMPQRESIRVAAGARVTTPHFHADGGTLVTVTGRHRTLDRERMAQPGNYD